MRLQSTKCLVGNSITDGLKSRLMQYLKQMVEDNVLFTKVISKFKPVTFMYRKYQYTSSQDPPGLGYGPSTTYSMAVTGWEAIASSFLPMAVARDMTSYVSYQIPSRWHDQCYITEYIIYQWYKSGCTLVPGSPFGSPKDGELKYPTSQQSHCDTSQGSSGHLCSFQ